MGQREKYYFEYTEDERGWRRGGCEYAKILEEDRSQSNE